MTAYRHRHMTRIETWLIATLLVFLALALLAAITSSVFLVFGFVFEAERMISWTEWVS